MKIYDEVQETMSDEARKAIALGLFPGAKIEKVYNPNYRPEEQEETNLFLGNGEEYTSPVDQKTVLVGEFVTTTNSLNGEMRRTHLSLKK